MTLFPRVENRLKELGLRDEVLVIAGGRIAEKEEDHAMFEKKIEDEGAKFLGVDEFFGPGTDLDELIKWIGVSLESRKNKK